MATDHQERSDNPYERWQDCALNDAHRLVFPTIQQLADDAAPRHAAWRDFEKVLGEPYWAVEKNPGESFANDDGHHKIKRCRLHIETYVSRWMKTRVLPMVVPTGGDVALQQRAEKMNCLIEGAFDQCGVFDLDAKWCGDGAKKGIGWAYIDDDSFMEGIWEDDKGEAIEPDAEEPVVMRCDPFSIFVDDLEWEDGKGTEIHWVRVHTKHKLIKRFPKHREAIEAAGSDQFSHVTRRWGGAWRQVVLVAYSWSLDGGRQDGDKDYGRRTMCIPGATLIDDDEWDCDELPFAHMTRAQESDGMHGYPIMADLAPVQRQFERYHDRVDESLWLANVLRFLIRKKSGLNPNKLGVNVPGVFLECEDPQNAIQTFNAEISPQLMQFVDVTLRYMQEMGRSSAMSTMGEAPKGIRGYRALQLMEDTDMEGLREGFRSRDSFYVRIGKLLVAAFERIGDYKLLVPMKDRGAEKLSFRKLKLPKGKYTWRVMPTAFLPKTAEGRMDFAEWLVDQKLIPRSQLAHFAGIPEIQTLASMAMAHHKAIQMRISAILEDGKYIPPHQLLPLDELIRAAGEAHSNSEVDGVDLDDPKMEMLRQLVRDARRLKKMMADEIAKNTPPPPANAAVATTPDIGGMQAPIPPLTGTPTAPAA